MFEDLRDYADKHLLTLKPFTLTKVRQLLVETLACLNGPCINDYCEDLKLIKGVETLGRIFSSRDRVLQLFADLELYAKWKKGLIKIFIQRFGKGRLRIVKTKGREYLAFQTYSGRVYQRIEDNKALDTYKNYLALKKEVRKTLEHYEELLKKVRDNTNSKFITRVAKLCLKEVKKLKRKFLELTKNY